MPDNFFVNSSICIKDIGTYHIISQESEYSYGNFIVNPFTGSIIGESRILFARSSIDFLSVKEIKDSRKEFKVFYTLKNGKLDIYFQSLASKYIIMPAMDYRYNIYQPKLIYEESEIPDDAKEFDYK